jgi:tyrosine-protein kinase Etk/Wzc
MLTKNNLSLPSEDRNEVDLGRLVGTVIDHKWLVTGITSFCAILGILYSLFSTPIYQTNALVQVEQNVGNQLVDNINSLITSSKPDSTAEIELILSRMVIGKTVKDLGLDVTVKQSYFPFFGEGWARLNNELPGEIAISRVAIPEEMYNVPLKLNVIDSQHYSLNDGNEIILKGEVNKISIKGAYTILVSGIKAKPGTIFLISKLPELSAINNIENNLVVQDTGKDTGVLSLVYTGPDRELIRKTLNSITQNYLLQNVERKSEEAEKSLGFLNIQIPNVRASLDDSENKLNAYRQQNDSVDLSLEARSVLESVVNIDSQLNALTFKEAEISKLYTKEHPAYKTLLENRKTLEDEKARLTQRISQLPKTQQEILRLTRDVDAGQAVYMQLVNKRQDLSIAKASTVGNIRIVDDAVTLPGTVKPQKAIIIAGSILLGIVISVLIIITKAILYRGVENPLELEEAGINVYASVPLSEWQRKKDREVRFKNGSKSQKLGVKELLALSNPTDMAIEAVRSLRTSLHFAMLEAKNNVLMISGASPSIGKTFISTNLSALIAQTEKRILLIDADLRKGYIHELLGLKNSSGLAELLSNQSTIEGSIQHTDIDGFDVITRGQIPPNPSELLMNNYFKSAIEFASAKYDFVIIDTPPILAVTDAAIIGNHVGTTLLVVRYGVNTMKEIEISIDRFAKNGTDVKGVIFNSVFKKASNAYGNYGYYAYEYKSNDK